MTDSNSTGADALPWSVTLTIRTGPHAHSPAWVWGASLKDYAKIAMAQWLLEMQIQSESHWRVSVDGMQDLLEEEKKEWRKQAAQAHLRSDFESALGWARSSFWALGREMQKSCGRNQVIFASGHSPLHNGAQTAEPLSVLEVGFFTSATDASDQAVAKKMMLDAFNPMRLRLSQAGPQAKAGTYWGSRLMAATGAITPRLVGSLIEREDLLADLRKAKKDGAPPTAQGDARAVPTAEIAPKEARGARRL